MVGPVSANVDQLRPGLHKNCPKFHQLRPEFAWNRTELHRNPPNFARTRLGPKSAKFAQNMLAPKSAEFSRNSNRRHSSQRPNSARHLTNSTNIGPDSAEISSKSTRLAARHFPRDHGRRKRYFPSGSSAPNSTKVQILARIRPMLRKLAQVRCETRPMLGECGQRWSEAGLC